MHRPKPTLGRGRSAIAVFALTFALLLSTVPFLDLATRPLGLPAWAAASLLLTCVYAIAVALGLNRVLPDRDGDERVGEDRTRDDRTGEGP